MKEIKMAADPRRSAGVSFALESLKFIVYCLTIAVWFWSVVGVKMFTERKPTPPPLDETETTTMVPRTVAEVIVGVTAMVAFVIPLDPRIS